MATVASDSKWRTRIADISHTTAGQCRYFRAFETAKLRRMYEDELNRIAFSNTWMVRDLIRLLPRALTADLNLSKLRRLPTTLVGAAPTKRLTDMPWAIGGRSAAAHGGADVLLTLAFQSHPDRHLALRVEIHVALLRQGLLAQNMFPSGELPQVLPVVVYTGRRQWAAPPTVRALTADGVDARSCLQPNCQPLLLDAADLTVEDMRHNRAAALLALQRCDREERIPTLAASLFELLRRRGTRTLRTPLAQAMVQMLWARFGGATANCSGALRVALRHVEEPTMLAARITEWCEEWRQKGRAEGMAHEKALLERQAARRFDEATGDALSQLLAGVMDSERLMEAGELLVGAETTEELLTKCRVLTSSDRDALLV